MNKSSKSKAVQTAEHTSMED